jgi:hypothetical protein
MCVVATGLAPGCLMGGPLGARTPSKGTSQLGTISRIGSRGLVGADVTVVYGITDDVAVQGRAMLMSLAAELGVRWRWLRTESVHLAVAPSFALGYGLADRGDGEDGAEELGISPTAMGRMTVSATFDLGMVDLDVAAFAGFSRIPETARPPGDAWPYAMYPYRLQGSTAIGGGAFGVAFRFERVSIRPYVEWLRMFSRYRTTVSAPTFEPENVWSFCLAIEWH